MQKRSSLKKLYIDTVVFVLLFAILGAVLLAEQRGYRAVSNTDESSLLEEDAWNAAKNDSAGAIASNAPQCLLLRNRQDNYSRRLTDNLSYTLTTMNVKVTVTDVLIPQEPDEEFMGKRNKGLGIRPDRSISDNAAQDALPEGEEATQPEIEEETQPESEEETQPEIEEETQPEAEEETQPEEEDAFPSQDFGNIATGDEASVPDQPSIDASQIEYEGYDEVIFCFSDISVVEPDIEKLTAWLNGGGHLLFAGGLEEKINLSLWADILGVNASNEAAPVPADSLRFNTDLLAGANEKEFSDDVISGEALDLTLQSDCTLHISTAEDDAVPLLWEYKAQSGNVFVCNADLMESKSDRGIIAAVYSRFYPVYAYPVINACVYCIDDCPSPIPAGYEKNVITQYGYTVGDFYANVWMPSMQKLSEEYGIKYSAFAIQTYDNQTDGSFDNTDNRETSSYYAGLILQMGGEVGIHGYNHQPLVLDGYQFDDENEGYQPWPNVISMLNSVKSAVSYTESLSDGLYVQSYVAPSNIISKEALTEMISQEEKIRVYAGVYTGTRDQFLQEYEVLQNGIVFCPRLTADMQMEDSEWWTQLNELNYHYIESNFIHPDDILDEQRSDGGDFKQMLSGYTQMIEWNQNMGLRNTTISECGGAVQRYCNLNYTQTLEDNTLTLHLNGRIDTAYMMIRTNGKTISSVEGGSVSECGSGVYILEATADEVTIKTVDEK